MFLVAQVTYLMAPRIKRWDSETSTCVRHALRLGNHVDILVNFLHRNEHLFGVKTTWHVTRITNRTDARDSLIDVVINSEELPRLRSFAICRAPFAPGIYL